MERSKIRKSNVLMKTKLVVSALIVFGACLQAQAARISAVSKTGGSGEVPAITDLTEGVLAFTDRTHTLVNVPTALINDGDIPTLVQLSNDDKTSSPLSHDVTVSQLSLLYVGLDDRLTTQPLPWMSSPGDTGLPAAFFDTGAQIDIDEGAVRQAFVDDHFRQANKKCGRRIICAGRGFHRGGDRRKAI